MAETPEKGVETQKRFIERLRKTPQAAELAITPVLLSLTCWIFDDLKCLPEKRSDLYRDGLDLLLQQWDEGRGISRDSGCDRYQKLTTEERKQLLSYLAFRKFEQAENFVLFEESELCGYIAEYLQISADESQAVLQAIAQQHGLLVERAHRIWSFSHLTFQEYLVARQILEKCNSLSRNDPVLNRLASHITDKHWSEVFLLIVAMLDNSDAFLHLMKTEIDKLLQEDEILQKFLVWVNQKAKSTNSHYKVAAIRSFYFEGCQLELFREIDSTIFEYLDKIPLLKLNGDIRIDYNLQEALYSSYTLNQDIQNDPGGHPDHNQALY